MGTETELSARKRPRDVQRLNARAPAEVRMLLGRLDHLLCRIGVDLGESALPGNCDPPAHDTLDPVDVNVMGNVVRLVIAPDDATAFLV